jgi:cofilin
MEKGEIVVDKTVAASKEDNQATYEEFIGTLSPKESRYCIYDLNYTLKDGGERSKLLFITWNPDGASIKQKMTYSSSKAELKKKLNGVADDIQATDFDEIEYETVYNKCSACGTK